MWTLLPRSTSFEHELQLGCITSLLAHDWLAEAVHAAESAVRQSCTSSSSCTACLHAVICLLWRMCVGDTCWALLQVRGSIPLYWNQEGITTLKPDITLQHYDPLYTATRLHFEVAFLHTRLRVPQPAC